MHRTPFRSYVIGGKAAQTGYYAREHARRIGFPLNYGVTINFALTSIAPDAAVKAFALLRRHHFNKWAARPRRGQGKPFPPTYIFAFENVRDGIAFQDMGPGEPHNVHVHWEVHIPPARLFAFEVELWRWVELTCGDIHSAQVIKITSLPESRSRKNYLAKGTTKGFAQIYGRGQKAEPQGIIVGGRRAEASRNLGPTARRRLDKHLGVVRRLPSKQRHPYPPNSPVGA